ncbi:MAG: zinc-ribbon domain-containing protein [Hungatella sp.]|jgi:hypothetical protein|nr:zinc-ribbon domain-containing protein [Hungatella sp.]
MFCRNCGTQLRDGARFCESCGTRVNPEENHGNINKVISNKMQEMNVFKYTRIVVWVICAVLVIMFFLPMFSISFFGFMSDFSTYEIMVGKEIKGYIVKGNALVALLVLIPPLIALFYDRKNIHFSAAFSSLGMIALVIFANYVRTRVSEETESLVNSVQFTNVYTFSMVFYMVAGILSCWGVFFKNTMEPNDLVKPDNTVMPLDKDSNRIKLSQKELSEYAKLADFANAIYNGLYHVEETQSFTKNVDIRTENLSSFTRAGILFWYQYFNNSSDERIKTEGNKFYHYHRVAINDLEDMMTGLVGSCSDDDMQSFRMHYITKHSGDMSRTFRKRFRYVLVEKGCT